MEEGGQDGGIIQVSFEQLELRDLSIGVKGCIQKNKQTQQKIWIKCQVWAENKRKSLNFDSTIFIRRKQLKREYFTLLSNSLSEKLKLGKGGRTWGEGEIRDG